MVSTFTTIKLDIQTQMRRHEEHLIETTQKFQSVDRRVDVDLESVIKEMKLEADDMNTRVYNL